VRGEARPAEAPVRDLPARLLEWGVALVLVAAPLPFGAVTPNVFPHALLWLELACFALAALWLLRALGRPTALPPRLVRVGLVALLGLGLLQALPLGRAAALVSPRSAELREAARTPEPAREAETRLLGVDPHGFEQAATLSLDPETTASSLRLGAALACLLLASCSVAAERGVRRIALALLISAAVQGLYGVLVLASGHDMIWNVPKKHYLESATGTFVNRNHFAGYLVATLCCGAALVLSHLRRSRSAGAGGALLRALGPEGSRAALLGLLLVLGLSGLLLSFSRAGIACGALALSATVLAARRLGRRTRVAIVAVAVVAAAVPLATLGTERLAERYSQSASDFASPGGRLTVWGDTLALALDFPVVGTGFGTFSSAYPLVRSPDVRLFFRHAHNDALQWIAESGALGTLLLLLVLLPVLRRAVAALRGEHGTLAVGIAAGLLGLMLHALLDFQFRIPANAALGAALSGTLLGLPWNEPS
jgi:O-antigen ligase